MKANSVSGNRKNSFDSLIILAANEVNDSSTSRQRCMDFKKLHDDAKIYDNLQKAILVCDSIDNGLMRNELKNLIEQSIELFKMYHHKDGDSRQLSPLSPESPTSSMNPQLGIVDKVVNVAPQINQDCFIAPEMSMISLDTEENLDVRQSCLTMSPLRRFGIQLSQMLCSFGPYGKASDTPTIISPVPNYDAPMSPSLQYFISQHREAPPTLPLERFDFEEICRSTDADCDENEVRNLTTDDVVIKSSNQEDGEIMCAEISIDDNKQRLTEQRQLKRQQEIAKLRSLASSRIACEPNVNCQVSFRLRNASRANKVLLLETATVIGLSLCKAFLIWRNAMLQYRKFRDSLLNRFSTEEIASVRRSQSNFESIPLQDPTMAILTEQKRLVGRRYDDASGSNSGYDCDSNNSSNCDSNTSYVSDEIANCERPNDGITSDDDRVGCRDLIDDANDALLLTNRHSEDVAKSKSSRKSRSKLASARMQGGGTSNASLKMSSYVDKGGLSGTQSPWLHCLNSTDDKEFMESDGKMSQRLKFIPFLHRLK